MGEPADLRSHHRRDGGVQPAPISRRRSSRNSNAIPPPLTHSAGTRTSRRRGSRRYGQGFRSCCRSCTSATSAPGHELRHNELLNAVRQRSSIPAGTCDFDLPAFHYWLERPGRRSSPGAARLDCDLRHVRVVDRAVVSQLVRASAAPTLELANSGFFQRNLGSSDAVPDDPGRSVAGRCPVPRDQRGQAAVRDSVSLPGGRHDAPDADTPGYRVSASLLHHLICTGGWPASPVPRTR